MRINATKLSDKLREEELFEQGQKPEDIEIGELCIYGSKRELKKLGEFLIRAAEGAKLTDKKHCDHWHFRKSCDVYPDVIVFRVNQNDDEYNDQN